jgi:protein O-mannosyl-transferase
MKTLIALLATLVLTVLAYSPGLDGELIFDDRANLQPIQQWLDDEIGWQQLVFGNESGGTGRPVAMASYLLNASITGDSVWGLKSGNLIIHLLTGVALFFLLSSIFPRDRQFSRYVRCAPLILTSIWLLHPLLASTVLYVVQRMAMLSTLFVLLALLCYVQGRIRIEAGKVRIGSWLILLAVPLFTGLATFSKENGALALLLCGLIEMVYFSPTKGSRRPWQVRLFLVLGVLVPVFTATVIWIAHPDFYLGGYANRPFTAIERLLTECRVLFDYVGKILIPIGPKFSLLRDDYRISTGLFTPITTLFSVAGWIVIAISAAISRKAVPGFAAGIGIFLIGHSIESSVFPLLIYFEHRNYLPSIGIILSVASLLIYAANHLRDRVDNPKTIVVGSVGALVLTLAVATTARSNIWQSNELLIRQSLAAYPDSRHLRMELQRLEMEKLFPDVDAVRGHARHLQKMDRSSTRLIGFIMEALLDCDMDGRVSQRANSGLFSEQPDTIEADFFHAVNVLAMNIRRQPCENLSATDLAIDLVTIADRSDLAETHNMMWRLRFLAAQLFYSDANLVSAYRQARVAWQNSPDDLPAGLMLVGLQINLSLFDEARQLLDTIEPKVPETDITGKQLAEQYREAINRRYWDEILEFRPEQRSIVPPPESQGL